MQWGNTKPRWKKSQSSKQLVPWWSMVNWCLQWIHYQEAWAFSYCNLLPGNRLYGGECGLREKGLGKPNFLRNALLFHIEPYAVGLEEHVNRKGGGYKGARKWKNKVREPEQWARMMSMPFIFIPQGNFHPFPHLFAEHWGITGETNLSISPSLSSHAYKHLPRF